MGIPPGHLLDDIHDAIVTLDADWRVTYLNRAAAQFTGRPVVESLGGSAWEILPETAGNRFYGELHLAADDQRHRKFEEYCPCIGLWLESDVYPSDSGLTVVMRDITASKRQEQSAREREEQLRLALSSAKMGVWDYDFGTRVVRWSPELEALHGLTPGSFDGRTETALSLVHPEDAAGLAAAYEEAVQTRGALAQEFRAIWPDGSVRFLYSRGKVLCGDQGVPATMLGVTMDVTGQKRAANELQRKLEQMHVLSGLTESVNRADGPDEIYQSAVQGLVRAAIADRASILIRDIDAGMRYRAWSGLSDEYRGALEGHRPWGHGVPDDRTLVIQDVLEYAPFSGLSAVFLKEGIRSVARIPLLGHQGMIGKLMLYYNQPHQCRPEELQVAQTIATHVALVTERRQAEIALRDSESRFRATFFQAAVGITQASLSGKFQLVNERVCDILGYSQSELLGLTFLDITHPDHREVCVNAISRLLTGEIPSYSTEKRVLRKDGAAVWVRVNVSLVRDQTNQPQYFIGIVEDTNQRMQAERALRESEHRLILVQNAGRLGVWDCDLRAETVSVPPGYAELFGSPRTLDDWFALLHADDRARVRKIWQKAIAAKRDWEAEYRLRLPDGSTHWFLTKASILLDDAGEAARLIGVNLDITERKRTETALRESEELFRNLADTAPVMMWIEAADKRCTFFNKRWLTFRGRSLEQELGFGWVEGIHPDDRERCLASHTAAFDARQNFHIEYRLRRGDGEYRWVLCTGVPRFSPSSDFLGYIGSDIDITDLKHAQEQTLERQKLESLGVLTNGIAHDFNNLLGSILMDAQLAELDLAGGSSPMEQIGRIKAVAVRAAEIVRELMIYSGQDQLDFGPVDLSHLVEEMLALLKVSISKHAALKTALAENLPPVRGNAAQIRQIVMNLIINASEAIGERDGLILVSTSRASSGGSLPESNYIRLEVCDTGCGITEEQKARIFDPFFSTKFAGRGLGLAVVQGIVRAHGGGIHLTSKPGQGSTFQILLPCLSSIPDTPPVIHNSVPETKSICATLLLVEDEESLRSSVSKILSRKGFSVVDAGDGSAAVELLRTHPGAIDLILLDMTLPGTPSRDVIAEAQRTRPEAKVILTSAYSREIAAPSLEASIVKGFIRKPFQASELLQLLNATLTV
jgi:PAS domain S-box-containing protein